MIKRPFITGLIFIALIVAMLVFIDGRKEKTPYVIKAIWSDAPKLKNY